MKLADSFGLMGLRANSAAEMEDALGKAFKADEPVLIEVVHGQEFPSPWVHMPRKRMRGGH
jgi:thiamine pyrophosphate-dependent acetolactate synthase large subunit-like protein